MGKNEEKERKYKSFIKEMYESIENENRMWAVLFVFYCLFHQFFERKLSEYIVGPFLSTFQDTTVSRLLIIFIILFISLRLHAEWKRHEHISAGKIFMMILVIMIWAYYRFVNQTWIFTEMFASDFLCYIDVVPFYCVGVTVLRIIPHKPVYTPNPNNAFIIDNPIDNKKYDCFGHAQFAESMANKLLDTNISSGAFTLGIVAPWGFGKTSFINMMKKQMENKAIIIDFSPWIYGTDTNLTQAFFTELNKSLRIYNTSLSEDLMAYAELLDGSEMETLNILSRILKKWHKQTLEFRRKKLEETLLNIKQPIVIFIDDLDRLESKEIMEVLKIIRNSANFPNLRFVAAYDHNYLVQAIKNLSIYSPGIFLEKIFQVEYILPNFDKEKLYEQLYELCSTFVEEKEELKKILTPQYRITGFFADELTNIRDVKHFTNMFRSTYKYLHGNIDLTDLMNLLILKMKYQPVYNFLAKNHKRILADRGEKLILYSQDKDNNKDSMYNDKIDLNTVWKYQFNYDENQKRNIMKIVKRLFPEYDYTKNTKSINNVFAIERYFYDTLMEEDYPAEEFNSLWNMDYNEIIRKINPVLDSKAKSLTRQLEYYEPKNQIEYRKLIRLMFYMGNFVPENFINEYNLISKINDKKFFDNIITFRTFIKDTMMENSPSRFVSSFLYSYENKNKNYFLKKRELRDIRFKHYKKAIAEDVKLHDIYKYYWEALNIKDYSELENEGYLISNSNTKERVQEINYLFLKYVDRHKTELIIDLISFDRPNDEKMYGISEFARYVWGSWDNYETFVKSIQPQTEAIKEYIQFMDKLKESQYERRIHFTFRHIQLNDSE